MIHTIKDILDDYLIPVGRTIETLDLDEEAKTAVFVRHAEEILTQVKEAAHGQDTD